VGFGVDQDWQLGASGMVSEVFCEIDFEDAAAARQQRDLRIEVLQAQGLVCIAENLYRVDGKRVYLLMADVPGENDSATKESPNRAPRRRDRTRQSMGKFERR
jgi:hypothetical protein